MSAALAAHAEGADVLVATKSALGASNTGRAQGGIQAAVGDGDSTEQHFADTFAAGHEDARPELVRGLTEGGPAAIEWLGSLGVPFSRDEGHLRILRCGGASRPRLLQAGERTGAEMVRSLRAGIRDRDIALAEGAALVGLASNPNGWTAELDIGDGEPRTVSTGAVVLAAGGGLRGEAERLGLESTNHPDATPEVLELAIDLGAATVFLDSWQRHPTGSIWPQSLLGYALPETTRSYGATLLDRDGVRVVDEMAPRDVVADGILGAVADGRGVEAPNGRVGVWLQTPLIDENHGDGFTVERLAYVHNRYLKAGVDITAEPVLVHPVLHYRNGGLAIDTDGATTLPGLFAAGEIAGGVHGTNRLMGNSLLDTVVYGRRAGRAAASAAK
jgi:aspartate oxidase